MSSGPSREGVLALFRSLLRASRQLQDYNFRNYAKRRVKLGFLENRGLTGTRLEQEYQDGLNQLQVSRRQAILSQLYPPGKRSVMEVPASKGAHEDATKIGERRTPTCLRRGK